MSSDITRAELRRYLWLVSKRAWRWAWHDSRGAAGGGPLLLAAIYYFALPLFAWMNGQKAAWDERPPALYTLIVCLIGFALMLLYAFFREAAVIDKGKTGEIVRLRREDTEIVRRLREFYLQGGDLIDSLEKHRHHVREWAPSFNKWFRLLREAIPPYERLWFENKIRLEIEATGYSDWNDYAVINVVLPKLLGHLHEVITRLQDQRTPDSPTPPASASHP